MANIQTGNSSAQTFLNPNPNTSTSNYPVTVPDRNLLGSSDTSSPPVFTSDQVNQDLSANSTPTSLLSGNSLTGSNQLPDGSGAQLGNGIDASSGTSFDSSLSFSDANSIQGATNSNTANFLGGAEPVDSALLQDPSNVFNNGFGTIGAVPQDLNSLNPVSNIGKDKYDRVKLRFAPNHPFASYPSNSILGPLAETNGLVWPLKPSVTIQNQVDYESLNLTHSIQEIHSFNTNKAPIINITGQFVCPTIDDALYAMAAIHFLRSASKMAFGTASLNALTGLPAGTPPGAPPPVLLFSGYGPAMFNDLPVIINSYPIDLPTDVDYITIPFGPAAGTRLPVSFTLSVSLTVQQSPQNMRNFNLNYYTQSGQNGWW